MSKSNCLDTSRVDRNLFVYLLTRNLIGRSERRNRELQGQLEEEIAINRRFNEEIAILTKKLKSTKQEYEEIVSAFL